MRLTTTRARAATFVAGAALVVTTIGLASAPAAAEGPALALAAATSPDNKTIELKFNQALHPETIELLNGNTNYLANYVHISGGSTGTDAALDGGPINEIAGTQVWTSDVKDTKTVRVVLGDSAKLTRAKYKVWIDGAGLKLTDDLLIRSAKDGAMAGTTTAKLNVTGSPDAAPLAAINAATRLDARTVRVQFANPVLAGMPNAWRDPNCTRACGVAATGITLNGASPVYTQAVPQTDRTTWDLTFGVNDTKKGTLAIDTTVHKLRTAGGTMSAGVLNAQVKANAKAYDTPRVTAVTVPAERDSLVVDFNHKLRTVLADRLIAQQVVETPRTGVSGTVLSAEQVKTMFNIDATVVPETPTQGAQGTTVKLASVLDSDAAYFDGAGRLVIKVPNAYRIVRGSTGSVKMAAAAVTDIAGVTSVKDATVPFTAPKKALAVPQTGYDANSADYLSIDKNSTVEFRQNDFSFYDPDNGNYTVRREAVKDNLMSQVIPTIVVENKYIKATFVPEYGARMLSLIYKPTGNDLLYTNPTGTQYGFTNNPVGTKGSSPFYWNWLMVWGGVFPTVSQAEHGKYWFLPWDYRIVEKNNRIDIVMSMKDTIDYPDTPSRFEYGRTDIETSVTYSVYKNSPAVDMAVDLFNPTAEEKKYEYWTCTTLAPGTDSNWGSPTMDIVTNSKTIQYDSAYSWIKNVEKPANPATPNDRFVTLDKLKKASEWDGDGIAYAQDLRTAPQNNFWGVVNQENREGVVRIGDNQKTWGMKFWEWGQNQNFDTSIFSKGNSGRPYIELWAGTSGRFFEPATLGAGQRMSWVETYMPTQALPDVTNATSGGAANVTFAAKNNGKVAVNADVFASAIGKKHTVRLVDETSGKVLTTAMYNADPTQAQRVTGTVKAGSTVRVELLDGQGKVVMTAKKTDGA